MYVAYSETKRVKNIKKIVRYLALSEGCFVAAYGHYRGSGGKTEGRRSTVVFEAKCTIVQFTGVEDMTVLDCTVLYVYYGSEIRDWPENYKNVFKLFYLVSFPYSR